MALVTKRVKKRRKKRKLSRLVESKPSRRPEAALQSDESAMDAYLTPVFNKNLKRGVILTNKEVLELLKSKGFAKVSSSYVRRFKNQYPALSKFSELRTPRVAQYQRGVSLRLGHIYIDVAFLGEKRFNNNYIGVLLAVDAQTQQLAAIPLKRRTTEAFEEAIEHLISLSIFRQIAIFYSDRETSLASESFAKKLKKRHGITLRYLHTR